MHNQKHCYQFIFLRMIAGYGSADFLLVNRVCSSK